MGDRYISHVIRKLMYDDSAEVLTGWDLEFAAWPRRMHGRTDIIETIVEK